MSFARKRGLQNQIYLNIKFFLDDLFLQEGRYFNVASGDTNYKLEDISQLQPNLDNDRFLGSSSKAYIWEGLRNNWVWESGFTLASGVSTPTIASGVYINGNFVAKHDFDTVSGIQIDFNNGAVFIESGIPTTYTVKVAYSWKDVLVDTTSFDVITEIIDNKVRNRFGPAITETPSGKYVQLPQVLMEIKEEPSARGLQLGGGRWRDPLMTFFIIAEDRYERDDLIDEVKDLQFQTINMIDFDAVTLPLNFYGDTVTSGFQSYSQMVASHNFRKLYFKNISLIDSRADENGYFIGTLEAQLEIAMSDK